MKNKKKFLRTSISALVVVATVLISVVATIKYKEDYDEEKRFNYIRENVEKSSEEKILYNLKKKNKDIVGYLSLIHIQMCIRDRTCKGYAKKHNGN